MIHFKLAAQRFGRVVRQVIIAGTQDNGVTRTVAVGTGGPAKEKSRRGCRTCRGWLGLRPNRPVAEMSPGTAQMRARYT